MIVSAIDGRIRYVHPALKNEAVAGALEAYLPELGIVSFAEVNKTTGSLLVLYEGGENNQWAIIRAIKRQVKKHGGRNKIGPRKGRRARKAVKFIMAGTITGSMALLFAGSERWHYRIGAAFITALGLHLIQNRRTFLR